MQQNGNILFSEIVLSITRIPENDKTTRNDRASYIGIGIRKRVLFVFSPDRVMSLWNSRYFLVTSLFIYFQVVYIYNAFLVI